MTDQPVIGHGSTLNPHGIEFSTPNRNAPDYRDYVERLHREGDPINGIPPTRPPLLIALCSRAMGSGKSEVARHLVERHGFTLLKFAGPLKAMTRTLLSQLGEDTATIERRVEGDLKEAEIPALRRSCRYLMQRIGTELGRQLLHEDVWADVTIERATGLLAAGKSVVIDDMRYTNEIAAVQRAGGHGLRIIRPGATVTSVHISEGELDDVPMTEMLNVGTLADLYAAVDTALESLN